MNFDEEEEADSALHNNQQGRKRQRTQTKVQFCKYCDKLTNHKTRRSKYCIAHDDWVKETKSKQSKATKRTVIAEDPSVPKILDNTNILSSCPISDNSLILPKEGQYDDDIALLSLATRSPVATEIKNTSESNRLPEQQFQNYEILSVQKKNKDNNENNVRAHENTYKGFEDDSNIRDHTHVDRSVQISTGMLCIPIVQPNENSDSDLNYDCSDVENGEDNDESSVDSWGE